MHMQMRGTDMQFKLKIMRMQTKVVLFASPALSEISTIQLHSLHFLYNYFLPPVPTNLVESEKRTLVN